MSRVKIENLHVNNYNDSDSSDSEDETQNDFSDLIDNSTNVNHLIEIYYKHYDNKYYLKYPEFATNKLCLDKKHLKNLPILEERTRENIRQWFIDSKITFEQIIFAGW